MNVKEVLGIGTKALENRDRASGVKRDQGKTGKAAAESNSASTDKVNISGRSKEMAKAAEVLANTTDVRTRKVAEIKERLAKGEYTVDADKVAQKMIVDFLGEIA
jgi:negative regulator of flagellin synthesis FlgM